MANWTLDTEHSSLSDLAEITVQLSNEQAHGNLQATSSKTQATIKMESTVFLRGPYPLFEGK